jgi:hypothetical protein
MTKDARAAVSLLFLVSVSWALLLLLMSLL